jgi:cell division protein FtsQ
MKTLIREQMRVPTPGEIDARIEERRAAVAAEAKRRRRARAMSACIGAACAAVLAGGALSPVFGVRDVGIEGAEGAAAAQVRRVAGLTGTPNLLRLDVDRMRRSIETLPWVASARVKRSFPWRVTIAVSPRVPVAAVRSGPWMVLIDAEAVVLNLALANSPPPWHVPVLDAGETGRIPLTGAVWDHGSVTQLLRVARDLPPDVRAATATVSDPDRPRLHLTDGVVVLLGSDEDVLRKGAVLRAIRADLARNGTSVRLIDVTSPDAPAVKP